MKIKFQWEDILLQDTENDVYHLFFDLQYSFINPINTIQAVSIVSREETFDMSDVIEKIQKRINESIHNQDFHFDSHDGIFEQIKSALLIIINEIEENQFPESTNDLDWKISFSLLCNPYVESVFRSINREDLIIDPSFGPRGSKVPKIDYFINKINETTNNTYYFISPRIFGLMWFGGGNHFAFEAYMKNIIEYTCQITKLIEEFPSYVKQLKIDYAHPHHYFKYKYLYDWLTQKQSNLISLFVLANKIKAEINDFKTLNDVNRYYEIRNIKSFSGLWNGLLYEFFNPYPKEQKLSEKQNLSITKIISNLKKDEQLSSFLNNLNFLNFYEGKDDPKTKNKPLIFNDKFFEKWTTKLKQIRNNNFHLSKNDDLYFGVDDYLVQHLEYSKTIDVNLDVIIKFIDIICDLVFQFYLLIWTIFVSLTKTILPPTDRIKEFLERYKNQNSN